VSDKSNKQVIATIERRLERLEERIGASDRTKLFVQILVGLMTAVATLLSGLVGRVH